jgi:hypothetical protein
MGFVDATPRPVAGIEPAALRLRCSALINCMNYRFLPEVVQV